MSRDVSGVSFDGALVTKNDSDYWTITGPYGEALVLQDGCLKGFDIRRWASSDFATLSLAGKSGGLDLSGPQLKALAAVLNAIVNGD